MKLQGPKGAGSQGRPGDHGDLLHYFLRRPESCGYQLLFGQPCRGACRDRAAGHSQTTLALMRGASQSIAEPLLTIGCAIPLFSFIGATCTHSLQLASLFLAASAGPPTSPPEAHRMPGTM